MVNATALVIGGSGFVGRHTVTELRDKGYDITTLSRGVHEFQFPNRMAVDHISGDRSKAETLAEVAEQAEPDIVIDCAAFSPADVRAATDIFADVDAYVYFVLALTAKTLGHLQPSIFSTRFAAGTAGFR